MRSELIGPLANPPRTLTDLLAGLQRNKRLSARRRRRRRSVVFRVARLLGDEPGAIVVDSIGARLATINPVAAGITAKTLANIRSEFLGAVKDRRAAGQGRGQQGLNPGLDHIVRASVGAAGPSWLVAPCAPRQFSRHRTERGQRRGHCRRIHRCRS